MSEQETNILVIGGREACGRCREDRLVDSRFIHVIDAFFNAVLRDGYS